MHGVPPAIAASHGSGRGRHGFLRGATFLALLIASAVYAIPSTQQSSPGQAAESATPQQLQQAAAQYQALLAHPAPGVPPAQLDTIRLRLGTAWFLLQRYTDSLHALDPLVSGDTGGSELPGIRPVLAQAWLICGLDNLQLNRPRDAIAPLEHALAFNPGSANARLALGDAFARAGRMQDAEQQYEAQLRLTPSLPDAWYKLGMVHIQLASEWKTRLASDPDARTLSQELQAHDLLAGEANWDAARLLLALSRSAPRQPGVHSGLGRALFALGYTKSAREEFQKELAFDPEDPSAMLGLAEAEAMAGLWTAADAEIDRLARSQALALTRLVEAAPPGPLRQAWNDGSIPLPQDVAATPEGAFWKTWLTTSSLTPAMLSSLPAPVRECARAVPQSAATLGVWLSQACYQQLLAHSQSGEHIAPARRPNLVEAMFRLGKYSDALALARSLLHSDSQRAVAAYWLSRIHSELAGDCFVRLALLDPASARVHQMVAERYLGFGQFTKAVAEYQTAIRLAPSLPDLYLGLGDVYARMMDWPQAATEFRKTLALAPGSLAARAELGHACVEMGDWQSAIALLRAIPANAPQAPAASLDLADADNRMGDPRQAIADLLPFADQDKNGEIHFRLANFYRKIGDVDAAKQAMQTFQSLRAAQLAVSHSEIQALESEKAANSSAPRASN